LPRIVAVLRGTARRAVAPRGARRSLHRTPSDPHRNPAQRAAGGGGRFDV